MKKEREKAKEKAQVARLAVFAVSDPKTWAKEELARV